VSSVEQPHAPIFVVGVARSGTTLLRYMLCGNPRIYLPPESNFIPRFFRRKPTGELRPERAIAILERIRTYGTFWRDWRDEPLDPVEVVRGLERVTPASLIDAIYGRYARQHGAARWGDKSTIHSDWIELLVGLFPDCQIVHMIRDVRDVTASSLDAYSGPRFFYMDPYYAARMWRERVSAGLAVGRRLPPGRYHEIRYEDLTADPERQLRELCAFLREDFHPAMLAPSEQATKHYHSVGIHHLVRSQVTTARSGRWRTDLAPRDQRLVQRVAGELLSDLGYPLEDLGRPDVAERERSARLRLKFEVVNLARGTLRTVGVFNSARLLRGFSRRRHPSHPHTRPAEAVAPAAAIGDGSAGSEPARVGALHADGR
jgi:Sulfotransferase family